MDSSPAKLTVINFWAGPGAGKSTAAAGLFNLLKNLGVRVELVTEFAKDATYQWDMKALGNQLYVLAQQDMRLHRLRGEVDIAITDSPLPLSLVYARGEWDVEWFEDACWGAFDRYDNLNVLVERVKPYQQYGRSQTLSEAESLDIEVRGMAEEAGLFGEACLAVQGDKEAPYQVLRWLKRLGVVSEMVGNG